MSVLTGTIQLRKDTEANFTSSNPVLLNGEVAISTDNTYAQTNQPRFKIGNGVDTWTALDYQPVDTQLTALVVNGTGGNLLRTEYRVVKVTSAQGQRLQVNLAQANNDPNSADTLGIVAEDISNNQSGYIMLYGQILNINTTGSLQGETWNDGDILYLSATVAGGITNIRPTAPNHGVTLGYVEYAHQNNGKIFVKIQNGAELGELHDLYVPNPIDNDTIVWSSGNTRYENKQLLGYTFLISNASINFVDATTYYYGGSASVAPATTDNTFRFVYPKSGTIKAVGVSHRIVTTLGTNESCQLGVGVNTNYTNFTTSYTLDINTRQTLYSGLNVSVVAGDYGTIRFIAPTWVTNPTGVLFTFTLYIE